MARYNAERLSNNLARVKSLNLREPIAEAYFPKMEFPSRVANTHLKDLKRESEKIQYDVTDLERWSSHIVEACHQGFVLDVSKLERKRYVLVAYEYKTSSSSSSES